MIYTELTRKAMQIAYNAHHGQLDSSGVPYVFHPFDIAEQMTDETTVCIALLHDVVEDTDMTMEELEEEFPKEVIDALKILTHDGDYSYEDYLAYIKEISKNRDAAIVKVADIRHNMDEGRLVGINVSQEKKDWWRKKYQAALNILSTDINYYTPISLA